MMVAAAAAATVAEVVALGSQSVRPTWIPLAWPAQGYYCVGPYSHGRLVVKRCKDLGVFAGFLGLGDRLSDCSQSFPEQKIGKKLNFPLTSLVHFCYASAPTRRVDVQIIWWERRLIR